MPCDMVLTPIDVGALPFFCSWDTVEMLRRKHPSQQECRLADDRHSGIVGHSLVLTILARPGKSELGPIISLVIAMPIGFIVLKNSFFSGAMGRCLNDICHSGKPFFPTPPSPIFWGAL